MPFNEPIDGPDPILSIGITGHRSIADEPIVSDAVEAAITSVLQALENGSRRSTAAKPFSTSRRFRLKMVSMLAEGADLLGMQAGLDCGAELIGVLPFDEKSYRDAFASAPSRALFDTVWSKLSSIVVLEDLWVMMLLRAGQFEQFWIELTSLSPCGMEIPHEDEAARATWFMTPWSAACRLS